MEKDLSVSEKKKKKLKRRKGQAEPERQSGAKAGSAGRCGGDVRGEVLRGD